MSAPSTNRDRRVASLTKRVIDLEARLDALESECMHKNENGVAHPAHAQGSQLSRASAPGERGRDDAAE